MSSYLKIINYYLKFKPENTELQGSSVFPTFLHLLLPWFLGADHVVVVVRKQFSVPLCILRPLSDSKFLHTFGRINFFEVIKTKGSQEVLFATVSQVKIISPNQKLTDSFYTWQELKNFILIF